MIVKAVIFDMDGVLTESMKYHIVSWKYALNQYDIFPTDIDLGLLEGMSYKETIDFLSNKYSVPLAETEKEKIYAIKKEKLEEIVHYAMYPHALDLLELLRERNIPLALVSGANKGFVQNVISRFLDGFFEVIVTGSDVQNGKPNPEPYLKAIEKLQHKPENILVIENAPLGIESAKGAHCTVYALTTTLDKKFLRGADKIFNSHRALLQELKNITDTDHRL